MVNRAASILSAILLVAFGLELVAILSVPVTKKISLCNYQDYQFGVFGYCNVKTGDCSSARIGYATDEGIELPSSARSSLSKLLIVHVVAAGLTFILFINALLAHVLSNSTGFLLVMLVLVLPTFLISLLAFLVDILLFVSHLNWAGWIVLASTVLIAFSGIILCLMRRTLSSQRAMKKRINENSELQNLNSFNDNIFGAGTFSASGKDIDFTELKYETSVADTSEDKIPLRSTNTRGSNNNAGAYHGDISYGMTNADTTLDSNRDYPYTESSVLAPREYRGYEPTPTGDNYSARPTRGENGYNPVSTNSPRQRGPPRPPIDQQGSGRYTNEPPIAGQYIPGLENERADGYGPNVVPIPRIRPETPPAGAGGPGGMRQQQRRPSGPRAPRDDSGIDAEYIPPRNGWQQPQPATSNSPINFSADAYSGSRRGGPASDGYAIDDVNVGTPLDFSAGASSTPNRQHLRNYFVDDDTEDTSTGYGGPAYATTQPQDGYIIPQPQGGFARSSPSPPKPQHYTPPVSRQHGEDASDVSSFYSTNQNQNQNQNQGYLGNPSPVPSRYNQPSSQHSRGYAPAPVSTTPPNKNRSDGVLESNPDFQIAVKKRTGGPKKPSALPRANDGPYGFK